MSDPGTRGPAVDPAEDLYRCITTRDWWVNDPQQPRPSSAAFDSPSFSVNIASLTTIEETRRQLQDILDCPQGGIVSFNCGCARQLGFDPRRERDPKHAENRAHANVYYDGSNSSRKKRAQRLARNCQIEVHPTFF